MTGKCCYWAWWGTLLLKIFSVNVALRQSGKFCMTIDVSEKVFDGDTNYMYSVFMDAGDLKGYLEATLKKPKSIQFVVVFHGERHANQLDFFNVYVLHDAVVEYYGYYSQKAEVLGRGMRVNCEDKNKLYNSIRVIARESGSYDIAELEAHSFAAIVQSQSIQREVKHRLEQVKFHLKSLEKFAFSSNHSRMFELSIKNQLLQNDYHGIDQKITKLPKRAKL